MKWTKEGRRKYDVTIPKEGTKRRKHYDLLMREEGASRKELNLTQPEFSALVYGMCCKGFKIKEIGRVKSEGRYNKRYTIELI